MRVLVFGGTGMLGRAVVAEARSRSFPSLGLSRAQADIADRERLLYWAGAFRPEVVVNCAAFTQVDACEGEGRERAFAVNGEAVANVAAAAASAGARLIHVSTDYVFDGLREGEPREPYREDDPAIGVSWPTNAPLLSPKDPKAPLLADAEIDFTWGGSRRGSS